MSVRAIIHVVYTWKYDVYIWKHEVRNEKTKDVKGCKS